MRVKDLTAFLRRIFRRTPDMQMKVAPAHARQMQMTQKALRAVAATREQEIGCDEAYAFMDAYAERIRRGEDAAALMPLVHHHLEMCPDCREELDALLLAMQATQS